MKTRWKLAVGAGQVLGCMILGSSATLRPSSASADEAAPASASPPSTPHISASWQKHQYYFQYLGFTTTYSCDGLADKLRILLRAVGARADSKSQPDGCAVPFGRPDKFARANLTFYSLAPLADGGTAGGKPVDAQWRAVSFATYSPRDLARGDCELVEQFRTSVLPMFTTRNIVDNTVCIPHQESGTVIDLRFEVLAAARAPVDRNSIEPTGVIAEKCHASFQGTWRPRRVRSPAQIPLHPRLGRRQSPF